MKNKQNYKFIFERGIETLIHVFTIIFYYTKNLELTFYHSQKAYYFYIEFIEQISDDNINFLHLSSRDAVMFVYKKTIFEINNEYRKNIKELSIDEQQILSTIDTYINIYKNILLFVVKHNNSNSINYINFCCDNIKYISDTINKNKIKTHQIQYIYLFSKLLDNPNINIQDFFSLLDEFIKKLTNKKKIDENILKRNICDIREPELNNFINNNELNKIVEMIFMC